VQENAHDNLNRQRLFRPPLMLLLPHVHRRMRPHEAWSERGSAGSGATSMSYVDGGGVGGVGKVGVRKGASSGELLGDGTTGVDYGENRQKTCMREERKIMTNGKRGRN
jgi:hypothetical protein